MSYRILSSLVSAVLVVGVPFLGAAFAQSMPASAEPDPLATSQPVSEAPDEPLSRILGIVHDEHGRAEPRAVLRVEPGEEIVNIDSGGGYMIPDLAPGTYRLVVEVDGEIVAESAVEVNAAGITVTHDIVLPATFSETVVVTATRTRKGLDVVPVRTHLIGRAEMENLNARTLADAVEYTTGVRVENNCQNCNFSQIRMLGLEGPYTQILVDGQPVISSLAQVYGVEQIPARMMDRIEVVKGGGSALYGAGSVGGVVNIIPREPSRSGFFFDAGLGSFGSGSMGDGPLYATNFSGDYVARDRRTYFTGFGQLDGVQPYDRNDDGFSDVARRHLRTFGARLNRYAFGHDAKLTVDFNRIQEDRRGGNNLDAPPDEADLAEATDSTRNGFTAGWLHGVSAGFDYTVNMSVADMSRDSYYGSGMDPNAYGFTENLLYVADTQFNHYLGMHTLSWGGQFSSESLEDQQPAYNRFIQDEYLSGGVFVQEDWAVAQGWQLLAGVRVDKHSQVKSAIASPRLALMYSPQPAVNFRASLATGFRAPQVFDEDLHITTSGGEQHIIFLDPDLKEERSMNTMVGVEWKPEAGRGQALFELNGFYTRLTDLFNNIENDDPDTPQVEFLKVNMGGARVYGTEVNLGWGIGDELVIQGGLVFQRSLFDDPEPDFGSEVFFRTPNRYGNLSITYTRAPLGTIFVGAIYTGPMVIPHYAGYIPEDRLETTPSFLTFDTNWTYPFDVSGRELALVLAIRNLTNAFQDDLDRGPLRDAGYVYGPRFPRTIRIGLRADF